MSHSLHPDTIVFLIRSYNESSRIISTIDSIVSAGYRQILVIDDGSTDGTNELLEEYRLREIYTIEKHCLNLISLRHFTNRGGGAAMETGFEYIRRFASLHGWQWVVTFDADGQMDIADMPRFLSMIDHHPSLDMVVGSRFIERTATNVPWYRRLTLIGGKIFTSIVSGVHMTDTHNGYRMFRVEMLDRIHLTLDGMEYASEWIDQIGSQGIQWREVPVNIHYDSYTLAKGQRFGGAIRVASRMLWKKFFQ